MRMKHSIFATVSVVLLVCVRNGFVGSCLKFRHHFPHLEHWPNGWYHLKADQPSRAIRFDRLPTDASAEPLLFEISINHLLHFMRLVTCIVPLLTQSVVMGKMGAEEENSGGEGEEIRSWQLRNVLTRFPKELLSP